MNYRIKVVLIVIAVFVISMFIIWNYVHKTSPRTTKVMVNENGEVYDMPQVMGDTDAKPEKSSSPFTIKEIMITNGVRHSVPLGEIRGGGPPKDGIPSIDNPKFVSIGEAKEYLSDEEPGIAVSLFGVDRFYPYYILVLNEIVNDKFPAPEGDRRVLVTYCPLCLSGVVFDPVVGGERVEFGTSGKLWQSNLVMYDRKTDSYWPQVLGEAVKGEMTGAKLKILPSDIIKFGNWRELNPNGEVLSLDTGTGRSYGIDPYGVRDYYNQHDLLYSPVRAKDNRLLNKEFILGIIVNGKAKAYYPPSVQKQGEVKDEFEGKIIIARYDKDLDAVRLFERKSDGSEERINTIASYWFAWVGAYPDTELYK